MGQTIKNRFHAAHLQARRPRVGPTLTDESRFLDRSGRVWRRRNEQHSNVTCDFITDWAVDRLWGGVTDRTPSILCKEGSLGSTTGTTY